MRVLRAALLAIVVLPGVLRAQASDIPVGTRVRLHMVAPEYRVTIALTGTVARTTPDSLVIARAEGIGETAVPRTSILDLSVSLGRESAGRSLARQLPFVALPVGLGAILASSSSHSRVDGRLLLVPLSIVALHVSAAPTSRRERWQSIDVAPLRP